MVAAARALIVLAVGALLAAAAPGVAHGFSGEQRLLVLRVTWGPEPFADDAVQDVVFRQTDAFMRASSFGKTWVTGEQTPWLHVFAEQPACDAGAIARAGREAALRTGFDLSRFNRYAYLFPRLACGWTGFGGSDSIWLNGELSTKLVAHELGHTYGLGHANSWDCAGRACASTEYGDRYDTMGRGVGDFNVLEKVQLGWISSVVTARAAGTYAIDRPDRPSAFPQALVVETARTEYWFENRQEETPLLGVLLPTGVLVRTAGPPVWTGTVRRLPRASLLLPDAAGPGRAALQPGETFTLPGTFAVTVTTQLAGQTALRFQWLDRTPPGPPTILTPRARVARGGRLEVTWREAVETGSGVVAYEVSLDGKRPRRLETRVFTASRTELRLPGRGTHRVAVRAIDRAGNRGQATVRRFVVGANAR